MIQFLVNLIMKLWIFGMTSAVTLECGNPSVPAYGPIKEQRIPRDHNTDLNYLIANSHIQFPGRVITKDMTIITPRGEFTIRSLGFKWTDEGIEVMPTSYPYRWHHMSKDDLVMAALRARTGNNISAFPGFVVSILPGERGVFLFFAYTERPINWRG